MPGTHQDDACGHRTADGVKVTFNVCKVHEWKNGKLTCVANYQDTTSLMRQLGLLPQPTEM